MAFKKWTEKDVDYLRENYPTKTANQIGGALGRSLNSIHLMAFKIGVSAIERDNNSINWTAKKLNFLQDNFDKMTTEQLCNKMKLTSTVIRKKMKELGLRKCFHAFWQPEWNQYLITNFQLIGDTEMAEIFQEKFPKPHPWTYKHIGKRRSYLNLKRTKTEIDAIQIRNWEMGRFAECANKRWLSVGVAQEGNVRIWKKNGAKFNIIKIDGKFLSYARYVWKNHFGEIPKGMVIRHKDGDSLNDEIDNLGMIAMSEHMNINGPKYTISDNYIIGMMTRKTPEKREELRKNKDLIELQRTIYKAKRLWTKSN